jgi:L-ascorbate metabolism protein UlaG (beta-lactamase superfamily)
MRVTHLGHSCLLVELAGARLLFDPGAFSPTAAELTEVDAVLITHAHPDHVDVTVLRSLLAGNPDTPVIAEPDTAATLTGEGIPARALAPGESVTVAGARVHGVGGRHTAIHDEIPRIGNVGMVVTADGEPTFYDPGDDLDTVPDAALAPEGVDLLALPIAGPWVTVPSAVGLLHAVSPRAWLPVHDAVLSPAGRNLYLNVLRSLTPEDIELRDLAGAGPVEV